MVTGDNYMAIFISCVLTLLQGGENDKMVSDD